MPRMPYPHCDQSCQNKAVPNASDNIKLKILEDKLRNDLVQKDLTDLPEVSEIKSSDYLYVYDSEQEQVKKISANEILNQVDLDDYAKKEELFNKDYNELINKPVIPSIDGLATEQFVNEAIKNIEIPETDLSDYYTKGDIDGIIENIELKEGPAGKDGKDFKYEDFTSEQLEALRGPQGLPGEAGKDGAAGKDFTYEDFTAEQLLALKGEKGEPFKYEDFTDSQLESLKGPQGEPGKAFKYEDFTAEQLEALKGKDGQDGYTPIKGVDYFDGEQGPKGDSAHISMTRDESGVVINYWDADSTGTSYVYDGKDGIDGKDGENGQSAYELWLALGNVGTEADFVASLKGQDGEKGDPGKDGLDGKDGLTTTIKVGETTYVHENGIITLPQYIEEIPDEYITETELKAKNYLTEHQSLDGYAKESFVEQKVADLVDSAPETLNTLNELAVAINNNKEVIEALEEAITKTKIGIDFTTNIALGHLEAGTKISKDQTIQEILYNILFKPTYDVKFIIDGTEYKTINVMQGKKVTKPIDPTKAGYEFKGWYTDETYSTSYNFDSKIMSETFIYALFEEITTVQVYYVECCEPDWDILDTAYSQELQKGQLVPMPSIDTIRAGITDGWEWDGNFYLDRECTEYFDFENTYATSDLLSIYLKITQLPEGPIFPEGSAAEEIVTNNIPAFSGSTSNGETAVTYQLLDGNTAEPTDQGFYTIVNENNEVVQAGYQLTMEGNSDMDAQVFAVPLTASMIKAWQYDEMGKTWLEYDFPGDYWRAGDIITKTVDGREIEYQTYYYNVDDIGDAISSDEYWRFEMEVNN